MARSHFFHVVGDRAGNAIQNATVTIYLTGTSTPVTDLYTAATGGSPVVSAQLTTNDQGEAEGWLDTPKTVDAQVSDTGHTAFYSGAVGETLTFAPFIETVEVLPPPEDVATQSGSNTFLSPQTFLVDATFAGSKGDPAYKSEDETITGTWTFSSSPVGLGAVDTTTNQTVGGVKRFTGTSTDLLLLRNQTKPYDFTHPQYGGAIAGDWTVAFNAAALACSTAGGGQLLIPEAATPYDLSLSSASNAHCGKIYSNVEYIGHGAESVLRLKANAAGNASGTRVLGTFTGVPVSNVTLADFVIDKASQSSPTDQDHGIYIAQGTRTTLDRLIVRNTGASAGADGIALALCARSEIANCDVSGFSRVLINTQYTTTSEVRDNTLHDTTGWAMKMEFISIATSYGMRFRDNRCEAIDSGISLTKGAGILSDVQVVGNYFEMSAGTGNAINIEADSVLVAQNNVRNGTGAMVRTQRNCTKMDFVQNTITGGVLSGTHGAIEIGGGSGNPPTDVKILGNTLDAVPQYGIYMAQTATNPFVASSIRIAENKFYSTGWAAIRNDGATGVEIHDNRFNDCGTAADACAIRLGAGNKGSARISIHDNRFKSNGTMTKGVDITAAAGNVSTVQAGAGVIGSAGSTSLLVAAADGNIFYVGQYIRIGTEFMRITAQTLRTDTCGITSGNNVVTDASIGAGDNGKNVSGTGITPGTTITGVTAGVSFTMSANATQTSASASLQIYTDTLTVARGQEGSTAISTIAAGNAIQILYALDVTIKNNMASGSALANPLNGSANLTGSSVAAFNNSADGAGTWATSGTATAQNLTANGTVTFGSLAPAGGTTALTQTYSTATRTHAALTSATLTDSSAGTANTTVEALPDPADTPASADALRDDLVANLIPALRNNYADLAAQVNALRVDLVNAKGVLNSVIDDLQADGLEA